MKLYDARRHAIARGLVAELDDFLDHLALGGVQRSLLRAELDQRAELFFTEEIGAGETRGREQLGHRFREALEMDRDGIDDRHDDAHDAGRRAWRCGTARPTYRR